MNELRLFAESEYVKNACLRVVIAVERFVERVVAVRGYVDPAVALADYDGRMVKLAIGVSELNYVAELGVSDVGHLSERPDRVVVYQKIMQKLHARP